VIECLQNRVLIESKISLKFAVQKIICLEKISRWGKLEIISFSERSTDLPEETCKMGKSAALEYSTISIKRKSPDEGGN